MRNITIPAAPNLPLPGKEFSTQYHDQLNNVLRLYFNRLSTPLQGLFGAQGGRLLFTPHGAFARNTSLTTTVNTPTRIDLPDTAYMEGVVTVPGLGVQTMRSGIYNYQYSIQFKNTDTGDHTAYIWLRKNGADFAASTSAFTVPGKHGALDGYTIGAANFYVELLEGEYVDLWWATDSATVSLDAIPEQVTPYPRPLSPAVVATLSFVSAAPE